MKVENFYEQEDTLAGWPVKVTSYKLGEKFFVSINNVSPGAWITKAEGGSLEEAEQEARQIASDRLSKTRVIS